MNKWIQKYNALTLPGKLIAINVVVYALTQIYKLLTMLFCVTGYHWQDVFALHANLNTLAMTPWTLFTYMFVHADMNQDIFHILFNMMWLYYFGIFFMRYHTGRQFLGAYLTGGLFAGLFYILTYNLFPYFVYERNYVSLVGASGAIFAIIVAVAMRQPNEKIGLNFIFFQTTLSMKWLAIIAVAISFINALGPSNSGGNVCHLGGAIWGFIYGLAERRGVDVTRGFNTLADKIVDLFKSKPKMKTQRGGAHVFNTERQKDMDYNARQKAQEKQIDAILDKMRKTGYNGLSEEEKRTLFNAGNKKS